MDSSDLSQELCDPIDPLVDLLHARREAQANVVVEAAVVARHDRDVVLLEQRGAEADGIGDLDAAGFLADVRADVGEAIERALRADAGDLRAARSVACACACPRFSNCWRICSIDSAPRGSVSAIAAGIWQKLVMWLVIWLCSLLIASITCLGPPMYPTRQPVIAKLLL